MLFGNLSLLKCHCFSCRSLCGTIHAYHLACKNCVENCTYVLFSNKITFLMDLLMHQLMVRCSLNFWSIVLVFRSTGKQHLGYEI